MEQNLLLSTRLVNKEFEEIRGFMGTKITYLKSEVDDYLQKYSEEVEEIEKEKSALMRKIELLESERSLSPDFSSTTEDELAQREKEVEEQARIIKKMEKTFTRMIIMAEEQAEKIREDARKEAALILDEKKAEAEAFLKEARKRHEEAVQEASEIVYEARSKRDNIMERYEKIKKEFVAMYKYIGATFLDEDDHNFIKETTKKVVGEQ